MEDRVPIAALKGQFFLPRKLRRRANYFWAFEDPKNRAIEMKVRKMKRNIIYHADLYATDLYDHYIEFAGKLKSLQRITEQLEAGILTPLKLRNAIYNRMLEEAADSQFVAAEEAAAAQQFIEETVEAAQRAKQAATAAVATKEAVTAAQFAKEAAEAAVLAKEAAENAKLAKRTVETNKNAKLAREAAAATKVAKKAAAKVSKKAAAEMAKKAAAAAQLADDEATPEAPVVEEKVGRLPLESCKGDE
uniref:protein anoxia up-regulated-like n=1 Tax=Fragaria vesca subsp. vesca TaxID=101020 RepID=UPI0005CB7DFC|nr:PREDICTED: protein anoxia up-regulated-like [Fragaria vesca subsp. vesca]